MQQKKITVTTISAVTGMVLGILAVVAYASGILDKKIDSRVEINPSIKYLTILVKEIATQEQKDRADKEFQRWNKQ